MSGDVPHEVLAVRDLTVRYGRQVALDAVSLAVPRGAVYALLGRNGAGKSSLIRCLLGQQHPARGHLSLFGLDPWPELLILDDPALGLDVVARNAVFGEVIGELADRGTTVFVTTHDLVGIEGLADRVAILSGGRIVVEEEMDALKARWARPLEEIFTA